MANNMPFLTMPNIPLNIYNSPKLQCSPVAMRDGTTAYAKINLPPELSKKRTSHILAFIPMFTRETFRAAPDGVYTWILSEKGFFANKVHSALELGTLHLNLAEHSGSLQIHGAGECAKTGNSITYNTLSGSFMVPLLRKYSENEQAPIEERVHTFMETMFRTMGFVSITRVDKTFIRKDSMPLTEDELEMYARAGYVIYLYDADTKCNNRDKLRIEGELRAKTAALKFLTKNSEQRRKTEDYIGKLQGDMEALTRYVPKLYEPAKGGTRKRSARRRSTRRPSTRKLKGIVLL